MSKKLKVLLYEKVGFEQIRKLSRQRGMRAEEAAVQRFCGRSTKARPGNSKEAGVTAEEGRRA